MRADRRQRGVALLLALLTMVLLTVVVVEFTFATQVGYRRAATWLLAKRAALVAEGGVMVASEVLAQDYLLNQYDALTDLWARELPPIDTGSGRLLVRIEDEQGRFNVNSLISGANSLQGRRFQTLLGIVNLDASLVAPLADWIDRNKEPNAGIAGAEDGYYATLPRPYTARNNQVQSFAELALVRGYEPRVLAALRPLISALPLDDTKVNPNTAPGPVLRSIDPRLADESLVSRLMERRVREPFRNAAAMRAAEGMDAFAEGELERLFTFSSSYFRVRSTAEVDGVFQSVEALLYRENGEVFVLHLLPRRGPNIVGVDLAATARIDDTSLIGAY
ncbi:MAG TPA: type II secretion system minor pseudopilin GspK [Candidatus Limnocylindrales bacterium]|nr:type II secretion system minor pseudopilin GspK [Candidatus Limnocylindrales bacterium]